MWYLALVIPALRSRVRRIATSLQASQSKTRTQTNKNNHPAYLHHHPDFSLLPVNPTHTSPPMASSPLQSAFCEYHFTYLRMMWNTVSLQTASFPKCEGSERLFTHSQLAHPNFWLGLCGYPTVFHVVILYWLIVTRVIFSIFYLKQTAV